MIRQAAVGLQYAYEHGLTHCDIMPSNLMLAVPEPPESEGRGVATQPTVKILDLGLALLRRPQENEVQEVTAAGQIMGTLDYMAPEQFSHSHLGTRNGGDVVGDY